MRLGRVVLLASTSYEGHQLYDQRVARALTEFVDVVYVEPAVPLFGLGRSGPHPSRVRQVDGLLVVSPRMLPRGRRSGLSLLTALWTAAVVRWVCRSEPAPSVLVTAAHPLTVRALRPWRTELLLKDDYVAGAGLINVPARRVERHRRALLGLVDVVSVVSPVLARAAASMGARTPAHVIPPGCEPGAHSADPAALLADVSAPRAVFIGMVSDRIDVELLGAVCAAGVTVCVVGRQQTTFSSSDSWAPHLRSGRIKLLGEQPPAVVAGLLRASDVGLLPYVASAFNDASFPLKLLEYLAAGLPVVSTDLPAVQWLDAPHVHVVRSADDVGEALRAALDGSSSPGTSRRLEQFVAAHTWRVRAQAHLALLAASGSDG
ncbi:hypothetical protein ASG41_08035 [Modestobacter sp. Leaf380]|nr:hypothetical protein ASG41_08035 [Modestobacter sp. Leaf380]